MDLPGMFELVRPNQPIDNNTMPRSYAILPSPPQHLSAPSPSIPPPHFRLHAPPSSSFSLFLQDESWRGGAHVIAAARAPDRSPALQALAHQHMGSGRLLLMELDVTNAASIKVRRVCMCV